MCIIQKMVTFIWVYYYMIFMMTPTQQLFINLNLTSLDFLIHNIGSVCIISIKEQKSKDFYQPSVFYKRKKNERVCIYSSLFWVPFRPPGLDFNLFFVLLKGNGFVEVQETRMKLNYWIIMLKTLQKGYFFSIVESSLFFNILIFAWKSTNHIWFLV